MPRPKKTDDQRAVSFGVTLPSDMWQKIDKEAEASNTSRSQYVKQLIEKGDAPCTGISLLDDITGTDMESLLKVARAYNKDLKSTALSLILIGIDSTLPTLPPS